MSNRNFNFADIGQQSLGKQASPYGNKQGGGSNVAPQGSILKDLNQDSYPTQNSYSSPYDKKQRNQMNKLNYINAWNQNQLYQQQYYLEMQNQQINSLIQQQEALKRELEMQRLALQQEKRRKELYSREKEANALNLLNEYERISGGGGGSLKLDAFESPTLHSRKYVSSPVSSPFMNNANMMLGNNPSYGGYYNPNPFMSMSMTPTTSPQDMFFMLLLSQKLESSKKPDKASEMILQSLEKQNQILAQLATKISKEKDVDEYLQARELERKIKTLETESSLYSPSYESRYQHPLSQSYAPPSDPSTFSPMQIMQLQQMFGGAGRFPQPPQMMNPHAAFLEEEKKKIDKLMKKLKKKEKHRKTKLKQILELLGLDQIPPEDDEPGVSKSLPTDESLTINKGTKSSGDVDQPTRKKSKDRKKQSKVSKTTIDEPVLTEEERAKLEQKEKQRKKYRRQALLWTRMYPILFAMDFSKKRKEAREIAQDKIIERIGLVMEATKQWVIKSVQKGLDLIIKSPKQDLCLTSVNGKPQKDKDIQSRINDLQKILKTMFDAFTNNTRQELLPKDLLDLLADMTHDYNFLPQNYMFNFELQRLNFTYSASLKNSNNEKTQMICCFMLIIRFLLGEVLFKIWDLPNVQKTEQMGRTVKTLSTIILYCTIEFIKGKVVVQKDSQSHLIPELRIKPRPSGIQFGAPMDLKDVDPDEKKKADETDQIMTGLYRKEQLAYFQKKLLVDELKAYISGWAEKMYNIVNTVYAEKRKQQQK